MNHDPNLSAMSPEKRDNYEALFLLHDAFNNCAASDELNVNDQMEHHSPVLQNSITLDLPLFLQNGVSGGKNAPMAGPYLQMLLHPQEGTVARTQVTEIVARFPYSGPSEQPVKLREDAERWHDVLLEIKFNKDGPKGIKDSKAPVGRYLLNGSGLTPYKNAFALGFNSPEGLAGDDLFAVHPGMEDTDAPSLTSTELKLLLSECTAKLQSD